MSKYRTHYHDEEPIVPVPPLKPGEMHMDTFPDDSPGASTPSVDKLIDINHHLMRRVEELEGIVGVYMEREVMDNIGKIKAAKVKND